MIPYLILILASESHDKLEEYTTTEIISKALKAWKDYHFKELDFLEAFKEDFEGWTEDDFKPANNHQIRQIRNSLRRRGVWVERSRLTIAKSLFIVLQEEELTLWTEEESLRCKEERFISYHIDDLLKDDFGRNPLVHSTYASISSPPPLTTKLASSPIVRSPIAHPRIPGALSNLPLQPPCQRPTQRPLRPPPQSLIQRPPQPQQFLSLVTNHQIQPTIQKVGPRATFVSITISHVGAAKPSLVPAY